VINESKYEYIGAYQDKLTLQEGVILEHNNGGWYEVIIRYWTEESTKKMPIDPETDLYLRMKYL
jgi:hypothetical protein